MRRPSGAGERSIFIGRRRGARSSPFSIPHTVPAFVFLSVVGAARPRLSSLAILIGAELNSVMAQSHDMESGSNDTPLAG